MSYAGCGVAGAFLFGAAAGGPGLEEVRRALAALAHRGPQGAGIWQGERIVLGHRRLSMIGLGPGGAQPLTRGDLTLTYNGELYNYRELRAELAARYAFESGSDAEVVLRAWQRWGPAALQRFNGMFSFALWNAASRELVLARDRIGIKPLYYARTPGWIAFASEVEALLRFPQVRSAPNLDMLTSQLLRSSTLDIDRSQTLVAGIRSLRPSEWMKVTPDGRTRARTYWRLPDADPGALPDQDEIHALLDESVAMMAAADVEVAAFLSGGIDSSVINAMVAARRPLTSVTVAYAGDAGTAPDEGANEDLRYSRILARHLGDRVDHRVVARPHAVSLPDIDAACDLASLCDDVRHVTMLGNYQAVHALGLRGVLNGQGADEIMGGYAGMPKFIANVVDVRDPAAETITRLAPWRQVPCLTPTVLERRDQVHAEVAEYCHSLRGGPVERAHRLLAATQLPRVVQFEDFLSMRASVEGRFPFLDHRIVEWSFRRPFAQHVDACTRRGKVLLDAAAKRLLPAAVSARPKQAFPYQDSSALHRSLAGLVEAHHAELRADDLVTELIRLPEASAAAGSPTQALWITLSLWRWHERLAKAASAG